MTLKELFWSKGYNYYPTDKDTHHRYLEAYSELFAKWREEKVNILEVGTWKGGSIRLFGDYFINANIIGYDIVAPELSHARATVIVKDFYSVNPDELPPLTIAIDDGPHDFSSQVKFVEIVYPKLVGGGIAVVEDVRPDFRTHFDKLNLPYSLTEFIPFTDEDDDRLLIFRKK